MGKSILFVCLANICRSPAAEEVLRDKIRAHPHLANIHIDSCGIGDWQTGSLPHERMREVAKKRGLILTSRARQIALKDFEEFDYILAADQEVLHSLYRLAKTPEQKAKIHLITAFSVAYRDQDIPDPFYKGDEAFEYILDMMDDALEGFIQHLKN